MIDFVKRRWLMLICFVVAAAVGILLYGSITMLWVGSTDLEVEFVVTDASTGHPIQGAEIEISLQKGSSFYNHEGEPDEFKLTTNEHGIAQRICEGMMCAGARSKFGFTDTFVAYLPDWKCTILAPGYHKIDMDPLGHDAFGKSHRTEPGKSRVQVPISLVKISP